MSLKIWTIYKEPIDFPNHYVARLFIDEDPSQTYFMGETLNEVRLKIPAGLTMIPRSPEDQHNIIETWF